MTPQPLGRPRREGGGGGRGQDGSPCAHLAAAPASAHCFLPSSKVGILLAHFKEDVKTQELRQRARPASLPAIAVTLPGSPFLLFVLRKWGPRTSTEDPPRHQDPLPWHRELPCGQLQVQLSFAPPPASFCDASPGSTSRRFRGHRRSHAGFRNLAVGRGAGFDFAGTWLGSGLGHLPGSPAATSVSSSV